MKTEDRTEQLISTKICKRRSMRFSCSVLVLSILFISLVSIPIISVAPRAAVGSDQSSDGTRGLDGILKFTESSSGLPETGEYNFISLGDFNNDDNIDIAFGGEDWTYTDTVGLYAYTGDGGSSWTSQSSGLETKNSWGGIALGDADSDGDMEMYAADEHWGSSTNSGLGTWEFRSDSWTDSQLHVSTPLQFGQPNNVILKDITGDSGPDLIICKRTGLSYFENGGGNPVSWVERSTGLPTSREFTGIAVIDLNDDGLLDIITTDYTGTEYIFIQSSSGDLWTDHSSSINSGGISLGVTAGDVNDDSNIDLVFGTGEGGLRCWLGNGGGTSGTDLQWKNASAGLPISGSYNHVQLEDIDDDGDLDIIAPESADKGIQIYLGNGNTDPGDNIDWMLASNTNLPEDGDWFGSDCYDINGDGALDIIAASWGMGVRAYLNNIKQELDPFNLRVSTNNIELSNSPVIVEQETEIKVKITNDDIGDALDFDVGIYINDELLGELEHYDLLAGFGNLELTRAWTPPSEGAYSIKVEAIPADNTLESNLQDNTAEISVTVQLEGQDNNNNDASGDELLLYIFLIIILIITIIVIMLMMKRGKKTEAIVVEEDV